MRVNSGKMGGAGKKRIHRTAAAVCEMLEPRQLLDADSYTYLSFLTIRANEGDMFQGSVNCVNLSPGHSVIATYSLIPGTADSSDYGVTSGSVTLNGNGTYIDSKIIYIPILRDNVVEGSTLENGILTKGTETFTIRLTSVSEGDLGYLNPPGSHIQQTITIVDDPPIVSIAAADDTATENAEGESPDPGSVVVARTGGNINEALTVFLTANGGTATLHTDYEVPDITAISAQSTSQIVELTVLDDTEAEGIETAEIRVASSPSDYLLWDPSGASPAVVQIDDNVSVRAVSVEVLGDVVNDVRGYDFDDVIVVLGEHLDKAQMHQNVNASTSAWDFDGNPLTAAQVLALFPGSDPNVVETNGEWLQDTYWTWQPLHILPNTNNGAAYGTDSQWLWLGHPDDQFWNVVSASYYYQFQVRNADTHAILNTTEWGYAWSNWNCAWTAAQGAPVGLCASLNVWNAGEFTDVETISGLL